jgi:hypothetical protein
MLCLRIYFQWFGGWFWLFFLSAQISVILSFLLNNKQILIICSFIKKVYQVGVIYSKIFIQSFVFQ